MATIKVVTNFSKLRNGELGPYTQNIIDKMTGNEHYPTPVPALAVITTALADYDEALVLSLSGGKDRTAVKNEKRVALEDLLSNLALYVQANCKNSMAILLSSGFESRRAAIPSPRELDKPLNFIVEQGTTLGSMRLSIDKVNGAVSYVFEYAIVSAAGTMPWISRGIKARTCVIEGLTSGQQYAFRVTGVSGVGTAPAYSDVITRHVQ